MNTQTYGYNRQNIQEGILHFGVGNFHRAHQAFYTDQLLHQESQQQWGICGASLLPSDEKMVNTLKAQHLDYTLTVFGRNGQNDCFTIGAIQELLWAQNDTEAIINKIANPDIKIISLTITEGGYNIDKATHQFILEDEKIQYDLTHPTHPHTVFGFVAEGLRRRRDAGHIGLTILSCDNLQHNGNTAKLAFSSFIQAQDPNLLTWLSENVSFPNSMVDRITPATTAEDIIRLNELTGHKDQAPVYCEDFIQWVIEDNFIAGRPAWEQVGVSFTDDVTAYENMKLSLLNASHVLLSYPSFLMGYRKVDQALEDADIVQYIKDFMELDISPLVPAPAGIDLQAYKQTLLERFANRSVSDQISRLCFDGISKFPVYIMPNLSKMLHQQEDVKRLALLFAAYRHYLKYQIDDLGNSYSVVEPWISEHDKKLIASEKAIDFLGLSAFTSIDLTRYPAFVNSYELLVQDLKDQGTQAVVRAIIA